MTHDEMIAVIQAHKEGKEIQYRAINAQVINAHTGCPGPWKPASTPSWDFYFNEYRVKPQPAVKYIFKFYDGGFSNSNFNSKKECEAFFEDPASGAPAKFVEEMEDD